MSHWHTDPYKEYQWIVADPQLLGGKLAIRGTRLAVSLILECLASGMSLDDIDQSFDCDFPRQALPEVLKVGSEFTDSFHVAACRQYGRASGVRPHRFQNLLRHRWETRVEGPFEWRPREHGRGRRLPLPAHSEPALWRIRFPRPKAVSAIRSRGGERPTATLAQYREQFLALCTEHPIEPVAGQLIQ